MSNKPSHVSLKKEKREKKEKKEVWAVRASHQCQSAVNGDGAGG